jgi:hypothetical protein
MKYTALLFFSFWSVVSYAESINLLGTWEDTNPNNHWHMEVSFNHDLSQYEGRLVKQGAGSQSVGFTIGELVWTAIPITNTNTNQLDVQQKWRTGNNGVSISATWLPGTISLDKSTNNTLIASYTIFSRVRSIPSISSDLSIQIPNAILQTSAGVSDIWAELKFHSNDNGIFLWKLNNYGINE